MQTQCHFWTFYVDKLSDSAHARIKFWSEWQLYAALITRETICNQSVQTFRVIKVNVWHDDVVWLQRNNKPKCLGQDENWLSRQRGAYIRKQQYFAGKQFLSLAISCSRSVSERTRLPVILETLINSLRQTHHMMQLAEGSDVYCSQCSIFWIYISPPHSTLKASVIWYSHTSFLDCEKRFPSWIPYAEYFYAKWQWLVTSSPYSGFATQIFFSKC